MQNTTLFRRTNQGCLKYLKALAVLLIIAGFLTGARAYGFDNEPWKRYLNINWNHYLPSGYISNYFKIEPDDLKGISTYYHNDFLNADVGVNAYRSRPSENYDLSFQLSKRFRDAWLSTRYYPDDNKLSFYGRKHIKRLNLYINGDYRSKNMGLSANYYVNPYLSVRASTRYSGNDWQYWTGLNVTFNTGSRVTSRERRLKEEKAKEIDWQGNTESKAFTRAVTRLETVVKDIKPANVRTLIVKPGQNLFRIILNAYKTYDKDVLGLVLHANPGIKTPDDIKSGQRIILPERG